MPIINQVVQGGGGSGPTGLYREFQLDANGALQPNTTTTHIMDFTGVKKTSPYILAYAYQNNTGITGVVDMSDLLTISGERACYYMFEGCTGLTGVDMSSLTSLGGSSTGMFKNCTNITSVDLSSLTSVTGMCDNMFENCTNITSVDLSSLTSVTGSSSGCGSMFLNCVGLTSISLPSLTTLSSTNYSAQRMFKGCTSLTSANLSCLTKASSYYGCSEMFQDCSSLTTVDLSSLTTISGSYVFSKAFINCISITSLSFPSITPNSFGTATNRLVGMCTSIPNITLHFPSNTQATIETLSGYSTTAPFGATAGTVLFDLPATNTLTGADSNTYSRNPKYDTATSLAWKVGAYGTTDFTPAYYTSGTTDPAVSDAIYSDAACTQSVTTITAIA